MVYLPAGLYESGILMVIKALYDWFYEGYIFDIVYDTSGTALPSGPDT